MIALLLSLATAQEEPIPVPDMNVQYFRPSIDAEGSLWVDDVVGGTDGWITPRLLLSYTDAPAVYRYDSSAEVPVVDGVAMGDLMLGWRTGPLRLGIDVPLILSAEGAAAVGEFGPGDVSLDAQVSGGADEGVQFGAAIRYALPTSVMKNPLGNPAGDGELMGLVHVPLGDSLALVANAGVGGHPGVDVDGLANVQARTRAALTAQLSKRNGVAAEWVARLPFGGSDVATRPTAMEGMLSGWVEGGPAIVRGGLGTALVDGLGSSRLRAVLGVEWGPQPPPPDYDGDGIIDADDACRLEAEDVDGVLDSDGCPDPTPKVLVDLVSGAGTPVDGRLKLRRDGADVGTRPAGQRWELQPGEYEVVVVEGPTLAAPQMVRVEPDEAMQTARIVVLRPGTVTIEVVDATGAPVEAEFLRQRKPLGSGSTWTGELLEGPQTILVRAPNLQPKRVDVLVDAENAVRQRVELSPARVRLSGDRIAISEKVQFETGSATILPDSLPLIDEVAAILARHPEITLLRVEGHTDATGDARANMNLSRDRANAVVDRLIALGIDMDRLDAVGHGSTKPLEEGDTPEAHAANRRVELVVVRRAE